jgi:drug/metabolite transporter (DMT)-like permease
MPFKYFIELVILASVWGSSFIFMRTAAPEFGPIMLITLRTAIAALCLLPFLFNAQSKSQMRTYWRPILFVGLVNTAIPFCLFSYSLLYIGAGYASVLNACAPMFGALVGFFWLKDNITAMIIFGLILGFVGVVILSLAHQAAFAQASLLPVMAALLATFLYGVAACFAKQYLQGVKAFVVAGGSQCFAALCLFPVSLFFWPPTIPSLTSWLHLIILGVLCTAIAYIMYFRLIANVGAANAITVAYLVPVFGVFWAMVFLQERLSVGMWIGAGLVLAGVCLATGLVKRRRLIVKPAL